MVLRIPAVVAVLLLLARATEPQRGSPPWRPSDRAPTLAGIRLGMPCDALDSTRGPARDTLKTHNLTLRYYPVGPRVECWNDSVGALLLVLRKDGELGGIRVGDSADSVQVHWGPPTGTTGNMRVYRFDRWAIWLLLADTGDCIVGLRLGVVKP